MAKIGRVPLIGGKLAEVGPEVDAHIAGSWLGAASRPMVVAALCSVTLRVEPALIADHDLAVQRRAVDGTRGRRDAADGGEEEDQRARHRERKTERHETKN